MDVFWQGDIDTKWNTGGNWSTGSTPTAADRAIIDDAAVGPNFDPTCDSNETIDRLVVENGRTLHVTANTLTIDNTGTSIDAGGTLHVNGGIVDLTITGNGTRLTVSGILDLDAGTLQLSAGGNDINVPAGGIIDMDGGTLSMSRSLLLRGGATGATFTMDGGTLTTIGNLTIEGDDANDGADFTLNAGTVNLGDASGDQLQVGSSTAGLLANATATLNGGSIAIAGDVDVQAGSTLTMAGAGGGGALSIGDDWTNDGTASFANGTVTFFDDVNNTGMGGLSTTSFWNLVMNDNGNSVTLTAAVAVKNDFTITDGTFSTSGTDYAVDVDGNLVIGAAGTFSPNSSIVTVGGNWTLNGGTLNASNSTVTFDGATTPVTLGGSSSTSFYNLTINKTNAGDTVQLGIAATATNDLTVTRGVLDTSGSNYSLTIGHDFILAANGTLTANSSAIGIEEDWTHNGGTFNKGSSTVTWINDGSNGLINGSASTTFHHLVINDNADSVSLNIDINVAGNFTLTDGTFTTTATNYTLDVDGNVLLTAGTFTANASAIRVGGNWTNNGATFTIGTSTVTADGASTPVTLGGTTAPSYYNLTINKSNAADTVNLGGNLILTNDLTITRGVLDTTAANSYTMDLRRHIAIEANGTLTANASAINLDENWTNNGGTFNRGSSTVTCINDAFDNTIGGSATTTFYNFTVNDNANIVTLGVNTGVANIFSMVAGTFSTSAAGNYTFDIGGDYSHTAGTVQANASTVRVGANWTRNGGTFTAGSSTVEFDTAAAAAIGGTAATTFYNLTVNKSGGATVTAAIAVTCGGNFTVSAGVYDSGAINLTVTGSFANNATFTAGTATVTMNGATTPVTVGGSTNTAFNNLTINKTDNTRLVSITNTPSATGALTLTLGILDIQGTTFTAGSYSLNASGTETRFTAGLAQTVMVATYRTLTINKSANTATAAGTVTVTTHFTISGGAYDTGGNALNVGGNFTNNAAFTAGAGTVTMNSATTPVTIGGTTNTTFNNLTITKSANTQIVSLVNDSTVGGTLSLTVGILDIQVTTFTAGTYALNTNNTETRFTGGIAQTVMSATYRNLRIDKSANTATAGGAVSVTTTFTIDNGTYATGGNALNVGATFTNNATFTHDNGTVSMNTGGSGTIGGTSTTTFYNLTIAKTSGGPAATLANAITVANDFTHTQGTFSTSASNFAMDIDGSFSQGAGTVQFNGSAVTLAGNWSRAAGAFTAGTSTVTFDGATASVAISGASVTTFHHVTIAKSDNTKIVQLSNLSTFNAAVDSALTLNTGILEIRVATLTASVFDLDQAGTETRFTTAAAQTVNALTYANLRVNNSGNTATAGGAVVVNSDFTIQAGIYATGGNSLTIGGNLSNSGSFTHGGGLVTLNSATSPVTIGGSAVTTFNDLTVNKSDNTKIVQLTNASTCAGTLLLSTGIFEVQAATLTAGTYDLDQANTEVRYTTAAAQNVRDTTYANLRVNNAGNTVTAQGAVVVTADFTIQAGTYATGGNTLTIGGNLSNSGSFTHGGGTVTMDGATTPVTIGGSTPTTFNNLTINKSDATRVVSITNASSAAGTLLLSTGILDIQGAGFTAGAYDLDQAGTETRFTQSAAQTVPAATYATLRVNKSGNTATAGGAVVVNGDFLIDGGAYATGGNALTIGGSFTNAATFTHGGGTVTLNGATTPVTIGGTAATTFHDLTIDKSSAAQIAQWQNSTGAVNNTLTVTRGILDIAAYTLDMNQNGSVGANGTLRLSHSSAILNIASGRTLTVNGTLRANPSSGQARIKAQSGTIDVTCAGTATLDIDGLRLDNLTASGLVAQNGATYTRFKNISFLNNAGGGGSRHLSITDNDLLLSAPGLYFDATAAVNIDLTGNGDGDGSTVVTAEFVDTATNGDGAGEGLDSDDDADADGASENPASDGAIVNWLPKLRDLAPDAPIGGGTVQGFPLAAIDWSTFSFYSIYVVVRDVDGTNKDTLFVLDNSGNDLYTYDVNHATYGDITTGMIYDTYDETFLSRDVNGDGDQIDTNVHVVYFGTTNGTLFQLIDTGAALSPPLAGAWSTPYTGTVTSITSPLIADQNNVYFGGTQASAPVNRIFGVAGADKTLMMNLGGVSPLTASPAWYRNGGTTYLLIASDAVSGNAHVYRIDTVSVLIDKDNTTPAADVKGPINYGAATLHVGDESGVIHGVDYDSAGFDNASGWPYSTGFGSPIRGGITILYFTGEAYAGDLGGRVFQLDAAGTLAGGWPVSLGGGAPISTRGLYRFANGRFYIGNENGRLFVINGATGALVTSYNFGAGVNIGDVSYHFNNDKIMVGTEDGIIYFVDP